MKFRRNYKGMPFWSSDAIAAREDAFHAALKRVAKEKEKERKEDEEKPSLPPR